MCSMRVTGTTSISVDLSDSEISKIVRAGSGSVADHLAGLRQSLINHYGIQAYGGSSEIYYDLRDRVWYTYDWVGATKSIKVLTDAEFESLSALEELTSVLVFGELDK